VFTACGIKHRRSAVLYTTDRRCFMPPIVGALYHKLQSTAPKDGRNYRPKRVELIEIINKIIIIASSRLFILLLDTLQSRPLCLWVALETWVTYW
jgi:hypothetical protein